MTQKYEIFITSTNGKNKLHTIIWQPKGEVRAILQISHGMIEHIDRYDNFARFLNERDILVVGNDHLGHGQSIEHEEEWGYFNAPDPSKNIVADLYEVTKHMKKEYPHVPYFMLGHSMGSFMLRRYIMTYGNQVDGAIIMGTGQHSKFIVKLEQMAIALLIAVKGDKYRSKFVTQMSLGNYNRKFKPVRTANDWISRDTKEVDKYNNDQYCQFEFTLGGYRTIFNTFAFIGNTQHINQIPKSLPILFAAGDKDPVGGNGKVVTKLYNQYKQLGINDVQLKLYKENRHEILNELDHEKVYIDLYNWIKEHSNEALDTKDEKQSIDSEK